MAIVLDGTANTVTPLNGALGATTPSTVVATSVNTPNTFGFKNRIINGAMMIDQRNAGASVSIQTTTGYMLDRWIANASANSKYTVQQNAGSVTPPVGYTKYLGVTSSSAYSITSSDYFSIAQKIEGFNATDLGWGTASASSVTLSFWVRSSLIGTFGGAFSNAAFDRGYPFTYTISAANTWEQKTVTIAGDTSGTWLTTNGTFTQMQFGLGVGSTYSGAAGSWTGTGLISATGATSVVGTNGATFYITGVQLEKGSTATSFDVRDYGRELAMCQRYCIVYTNSAGANVRCPGMNYQSTSAIIAFTFPVTMRSTPTGIVSSAASTYRVYSNNTVFTPSAISLDSTSQYTANVAVSCSGLTAGNANMFGFADAGGTSKLEFTGAEL